MTEIVMEKRIKTRHPITKAIWYVIRDSSNVKLISFDKNRRLMFVQFISGGLYQYEDVPYQRAVAAAYAPSVGKYVRNKIVPNYKAVKLA